VQVYSFDLECFSLNAESFLIIPENFLFENNCLFSVPFISVSCAESASVVICFVRSLNFLNFPLIHDNFAGFLVGDIAVGDLMAVILNLSVASLSLCDTKSIPMAIPDLILTVGACCEGTRDVPKRVVESLNFIGLLRAFNGLIENLPGFDNSNCFSASTISAVDFVDVLAHCTLL